MNLTLLRDIKETIKFSPTTFKKYFFFGVPHLFLLFGLFVIAYIHPVYGAGDQTHDLLIMSHLP
jgi:hypothetical protein